MTLLRTGLISILFLTGLAAAGFDRAAAAATIDRLVEADLAEADAMPNPGIDDLAFARRASLDLAGRIPTVAELRDYAAWPKAERRDRWVDRLIGSPGYRSHQFNRWADQLRIQSRLQGRIPGQPYIDWLKQAIADNQPYDDMVRELVAAEGGLWEFGQAGYYLRDQGMNQDNMANTVQVFLGTRIQCAQCHNHPFEDTTQRQFMGMAAYVDGVRTNGFAASLPNLDRKSARRMQRQLTPEGRRAIRRFLNTIAPGVQANRRAVAKLPDNYQYDDGEPGEAIEAHSLFGPPAEVARGAKPQAVLADWITDPQNPRFTTVIANRMWKSVMGRGLIEPVDDLRDDTVASNPELMAHLEALMRELDYDLQAFHGVLVRTRTYAREAALPREGEVYRFPGPVLRRLSAEQIWDNLMTLTVPDLDQRPGREGPDLREAYLRLKAMDAASLTAMASEMATLAGRRRELGQQRRELITAAEAARREDHPRKADELQRQAADIGKQLRELREQAMGGGDMVRMMTMNQMDRFGGRRPRQDRDARWRGLRGNWVRASELRQPMPPGHFLRNFGQSDRETVDADSTEASVVQALTLLNGVVDQMVLSRASALSRQLAQISSPDQRIRHLFLAILSREPSDEEWAMARRLTADHPEDMVADLAWALVNTNEFLFQH